jgi:hypothetical protein
VTQLSFSQIHFNWKTTICGHKKRSGLIFTLRYHFKVKAVLLSRQYTIGIML